jgi:hypothetical protein
MPKYAADTSVPVASSKTEIERTLARYGADAFALTWEGDLTTIGFRIHGRLIRIELHLPAPNDPRFTRTERGRMRVDTARREAYEQACRQQWRALLLVIKAKLEAVEAGISSVDREFLSDTVLPNGQTVGQWATPQIERAYESHQMPPLMIALTGGEEKDG